MAAHCQRKYLCCVPLDGERTEDKQVSLGSVYGGVARGIARHAARSAQAARLPSGCAPAAPCTSTASPSPVQRSASGRLSMAASMDSLWDRYRAAVCCEAPVS